MRIAQTQQKSHSKLLNAFGNEQLQMPNNISSGASPCLDV